MPPNASWVSRSLSSAGSQEHWAARGEAAMDIERIVRHVLKVALGISDKEARAITDVWNEAAKQEMQNLMGHCLARKFRQAALTLIRLLGKLPQAFLGRLRKKLGVIVAAKLVGKIAFNLAGGRLLTRLIVILRRAIPRKPSVKKLRPSVRKQKVKKQKKS
jgi:hypothetical protein